MKTGLTIAKAEWLDAIQNYQEVLLWIVIELIPILMMSFVISRLTTYYVVIFVISRLTGFYFENNLQEEIRRGTFSRYLLKPIPLWKYLFWDNIGGKIFNSLFLLLPILTLMNILYSKQLVPPTLPNFGLFIIALAFAYLIQFFLAQLVAYTSFFIEQAFAVTHLHWMLDALAGGYMLPLSFYPSFLSTIFQCLPFSAVYFVPAGIYTGQFTPVEAMLKLLLSAAWVIILFFLSRIVWTAGIKKYSSVGN